MTRREKLRFYGICAVLIAAAAISLIRTEAKRNDLETSEKRERFAAEEMLFECAAEAKEVLQATARDASTVLRLLRASVGGKQSLVRLSLDDGETEMLSRYFTAVGEAAEQDVNPTLAAYARNLYEFLVARRSTGEAGWEGLPIYAYGKETPSTDREPIGILYEKDARVIAEKALGGNLSLGEAVMQSEDGYLYVRHNAYVLVGISGKVKQMRRELNASPDLTITLSDEEAIEQARRALIACGYPRSSIQMGDCRKKEGILQIDATFGDITLHIELSGRSGALLALRSTNKTETLPI